jgi:hypothetical protein
MRLAWLTDIHLNFVDRSAIESLSNEIRASSPDVVLIGGDIGEAVRVTSRTPILRSCHSIDACTTVSRGGVARRARVRRELAALLRLPGSWGNATRLDGSSSRQPTYCVVRSYARLWGVPSSTESQGLDWRCGIWPPSVATGHRGSVTITGPNNLWIRSRESSSRESNQLFKRRLASSPKSSVR